MRKKYEKYKDSGIEWIGEVPEHWEEFKTKQLFRIFGGNGFTESSQGRKNGDYPFYKVSDINFGNTVLESAANYVDKEDIVRNCWNVIPAKSVLMAKIGEALRKNHRKVNVSECLIDNNMLALVPNNKIHLWLVYYLFNIIDMEWFVNPGAVPSVNIRWFKNSNLFIMPKPEQAHIINFLNAKTSEIDTLIADKEKLIQRLQEYKQSVITEAVTKGLNPDVKMKDSGIEWIGEVPEHWNIKKVKHICSESAKYGLNESSENYTENGVRFLRTTDIDEKGNIKSSQTGVFIHEDKCQGYMLETGDILISRSGSLGASLYFDKDKYGECSYAGYLVKFKANKYNDDKFLFYFTKSSIFNTQIQLSLVSSTISNFNGQKYANMLLLQPSLEEQQAISNFLNQKTFEINSLITDIEIQIQRLKEYRQSLIYEAVTGKIDVRDYKPENYKLERSDSLA